MREINFAGYWIGFKHGEINNPGKTELVFINQVLILTNFHPCPTSKAGSLISSGAGKKHRIPVFCPRRKADGFGFFGAKGFGHWAAGLTVAINNIAHTRGTLLLCPAIHPVSNRPAPTFRARHSPNNRAFFDIFGKNSKIRPAENISDITNFKRDPQIRLVIAIF